MTLRDDLEECIRDLASGEYSDKRAYSLIRDHGPALLEAVRDAERYGALLTNLDPDKIPGGFTVYLAVSKDVDQLIYSDDELNDVLDAAREADKG